MVQEFHVVRCFTCQSFQVQQVKKVNRWSCTLCGHKQSLLKEFGRGSGADCRRHVQKLNAMRGALLEQQEQDTLVLREEKEQRAAHMIQPHVSRWKKYLDTPALPEPEDVVLKQQQPHGNSIQDRKRKRSKDQTDTWLEDRRSPEQPDGLKPQRHSAFQDLSSPCSASCSSLEDEGPSSCGGSQSIRRTTALSVPDIVTRPRPLLPVSSMFVSGEEFNFDDGDFLTGQRI